MEIQQKLKINQEAQFHKLTKQDSMRLIKVYNDLKTEIEVIIKRDSLPDVVWYPSQDFEYLIRQEEGK